MVIVIPPENVVSILLNKEFLRGWHPLGANASQKLRVYMQSDEQQILSELRMNEVPLPTTKWKAFLCCMKVVALQLLLPYHA